MASSNIDQRSFKSLLGNAGLRPIRFHDVRHTCATLLFSKKVNPVVQERLGHANISETIDTYRYVLPSVQETAVNALEVVLSQWISRVSQ